MEGLIAVNGQIQAPDQAMIPALDRGFLFADNVFEVIVGFRKSLLDVEGHLDRLATSAESVSLPLPWSKEELAFELQHLAERLNADKCYLRLMVSRGSGLGLDFPESCQPLKVIYAFRAKPVPVSYYTEGLRLRLKKLPFTERGAAAKTGNYLRSILALNKAKAEGYDDVIWSNADGEITEATTANVFFIGRHGDHVEIATPSLHSGILKGITRARVISLLQEGQIPVEEKTLYPDEIPRFDEAFLCSTVRGLVPIRRIDGHEFHTARKNSTFRQIERLFLSRIAQQVGYAMDWNSGKVLTS